MAKRRTKKHGLRTVSAPFTVAAPTGARIRDRLRVTVDESEVLRRVGQHLGHHQRADLAERVSMGMVRTKDSRRTERKQKLTAVSSSRWAGAMTRTSEDQYQLSLRCLFDERRSLRRAARKITQRLAVPVGTRKGKTRGYPDQAERFQKQRRLQVLTARLFDVQARIDAGRPSVVVGGRRLLRNRHNLDAAQLTQEQWDDRWQAERVFLTADGDAEAPFGNYAINVDPRTGEVSIALPEPLRHLANAPRGRYRLGCTVTFHHRREEWLDRITAAPRKTAKGRTRRSQAVRYNITYDPARGRWYLDASWFAGTAVLPTPEELRVFGERTLGVDLNADHLAAYVGDAGAARSSAKQWPVFPPRSSGNACGPWPSTTGSSSSPSIPPTQASGARSTGRPRSRPRPKPALRGTTVPPWRSDDAASDTAHGVGQV